MLFAWVDDVLAHEDRLSCPDCKLTFEPPAGVPDQEIVCPKCEQTIARGTPPTDPVAEAPATAEEPPSLRTLKVGPEVSKEGRPVIWDTRAARTKRILKQYREKAGLTEEKPQRTRTTVRTRAFQPAMVPLWLTLLLIVLSSAATSLFTYLLLREDDPRTPGETARSTPASNPDPGRSTAPLRPPREVEYAGHVDGNAPIVRNGTSRGCQILNKQRERIWLLLSDEEIGQVAEKAEDPRARIYLLGRGLLYPANDERVSALRPPGSEATWILVDGAGTVQFINHGEFLRSTFVLEKR